MARGLDHVVHAVADLDRAAAFYDRCGFQVGTRNRHPWGTHNRLVQFPGFFIEILTVAESERLGDDGLSLHFGRFQESAVAQGDGLSMLIVSSEDAEADAEAFARSGIGCSPALPFSRQAVLAEGGTAEIGFALAFARDPNSPHAGFAACAHHNPAAFWNPSFQHHRNGATRIAGVVLTARSPSDHASFFSALTGCQAIESAAGVKLRTLRGDIDIWTEHAFAEAGGSRQEERVGASLRALRIVMPQLDGLEELLRRENVAARRNRTGFVVPPQAAFGATLLFEQEEGTG